MNVKLIARGLIAAIFISLQGCSDNNAQALIDIKEQVNTGGIASVGYQPFARFDLPAPTLTNENKSLFYAGRALAHQPWVKAPTSTTARDGLGPIFNARSCLGCHLNGGRGR
ncbi:MAG: di-heme oxidoredictase family protein, partial [Thalassolituus sp.]